MTTVRAVTKGFSLKFPLASMARELARLLMKFLTETATPAMLPKMLLSEGCAGDAVVCQPLVPNSEIILNVFSLSWCVSANKRTSSERPEM